MNSTENGRIEESMISQEENETYMEDSPVDESELCDCEECKPLSEQLRRMRKKTTYEFSERFGWIVTTDNGEEIIRELY